MKMSKATSSFLDFDYYIGNYSVLDKESEYESRSIAGNGDRLSVFENDTSTEQIVDVYQFFADQLSELPRQRILLGLLLLSFSLITILGNLLVIVAVYRERYLHSSTNYFVTSLAFADCLVGLVVMPFSTTYEVLQRNWLFGINWCDIWRSLDVLFSTASILNLCVISLDRYWAITDPFTYPSKMSRKRAYCLIAAVWFCSGLISFPAILWWRAVRSERVPPLKCPFTDNLSYLIFSSTISFYVPLVVMVFTYFKIYRAAVYQTRSLKSGIKQVPPSSGESGLTLRMHRGGTEKQHHQPCQLQQSPPQQSNSSSLPLSASSAACCDKSEPLQQQTSSSTFCRQQSSNMSLKSSSTVHMKTLHKNFSLSRKLSKFAKEKKAAKTLGIVMGVFIVCWLPFFVLNLLSGFCVYCIPHEDLISSIVAWLGWLNSGMNPFIYACWSKDFRRAFVRILCICCPRKVRRRHRAPLRYRSSQFSSTSVVLAPANVTYATVSQKELFNI